jgi:hypothetical protein
MLMSEEIKKGKIKKEELNYDKLFEFFLVKRKVKFLRYLLERSNEFDFKTSHFTKALDLGCEDMAMLLYKEFSTWISHSQIPKIISVLISSLNRSNGMTEYKCFLIRQFIEHMKVDNVASLLDTIE